MQQTSKPWYESITVWGVAVALLATIGQFVGFSISADVQAQAVDAASKLATAIATKDWVTVISGVGQTAGLVMALFGRNQASQPVHFLAPFRAAADGLASANSSDQASPTPASAKPAP